MSAIEASSVRLQTMADNTLRLTVDIEPRFAKDAFALFGERGTPMALAALKTAKAEPPAKPEPKRGLLSQWAAMRCEEPEFRHWLKAVYWTNWERAEGQDAERAANTLRDVCYIKSRSELDHDEKAAERFHSRIRGPWAAHQKEPGITFHKPETA